jgi:hypothetical protein
VSTFVIVLPRRPISANRGANPKFSRTIDQAARLRQPTLLEGPLYARIVWFHKYRTSQDTDNIAKRILDSLKGIVYGDDNSITHCLSVRVDTTVDFELTDSMTSDADYELLLQFLADASERDVLYIEIGQRASKTIRFGEVI